MSESDEFLELLELESPALLLAMTGLAAAIARNQTDRRATATQTLTDTIAKIMSGADILGRQEVAGAHGLTVGGGRAVGGGGGTVGGGGGGGITLPPAGGGGGDSMLDSIMARYKAWHAPTLADDASGLIEDRIKKSFEDGRDSALAVLEDVNDWTVAYADTVYRTNVASAYAAGNWSESMEPDIREIVPAKLFSAVGDSDTRPNHKAADGLLAGVDDPIWELFAPPIGYNSFAPGTMVCGDFLAASKARYSGPLVKIQTREGRRLSVTVNHPVLTPAGYISAGQIREGDDLLVHLPSVELLVHGARNRSLSSVEVGGRAVDHQEMPARIEDVFEAAHRNRARASVECLARAFTLDLHGDSRFYDGEVHIVSTDGLLPDRPGAIGPKSADKRLLMLRANASVLLTHRHGSYRLRQPASFGVTTDGYPASREPISQAAPRGLKLVRELEKSHSGEVTRDKVVHVDVGPWSGHVYDLQSPIGWIVANGIIASNCRCSAIDVDRFELQDRGLLKPDGSVIRVTPASFANAFPDPGFGTGRPDKRVYGR